MLSNEEQLHILGTTFDELDKVAGSADIFAILQRAKLAAAYMGICEAVDSSFSITRALSCVQYLHLCATYKDPREVFSKFVREVPLPSPYQEKSLEADVPLKIGA